MYIIVSSISNRAAGNAGSAGNAGYGFDANDLLAVSFTRESNAGTAGSATIGGTAITSGNFRDSDGTTKAVTTNTSGPVGSFNQSGNGAAGDLSGFTLVMEGQEELAPYFLDSGLITADATQIVPN